MARPFPGMNPYLETPPFWSDFAPKLLPTPTCGWPRSLTSAAPMNLLYTTVGSSTRSCWFRHCVPPTRVG
jgi:hypothetical protein